MPQQPDQAYALGHSDRELDRLAVQARLIDPITRRFFRDAGIERGMRILDIGSAAGDNTFLAADLVGETGEVVGFDLSSIAVAKARARASERGLINVSFREGDQGAVASDGPFDAVIGRYILMFQADPATMLAGCVRLVRPGGIVVFHEPDWDGARSMPSAPTYDLACRWATEALRQSGHDVHMGSRLHATFLAAGLTAPILRLESAIGAGASASDCLHLVGDLIPILLPSMEQLDIATASEVGLDTLAARMHEEAAANGSTIIGRYEIGAWARV